MTDERLDRLREIYKNRKLLEELNWGRHANHNRYNCKLDAEFLNWLCDKAYHEIKEKQNSVPMENIDKMIAEIENCSETYVAGWDKKRSKTAKEMKQDILEIINKYSPR